MCGGECTVDAHASVVELEVEDVKKVLTRTQKMWTENHFQMANFKQFYQSEVFSDAELLVHVLKNDDDLQNNNNVPSKKQKTDITR